MSSPDRPSLGALPDSEIPDRIDIPGKSITNGNSGSRLVPISQEESLGLPQSLIVEGKDGALYTYRMTGKKSEPKTTDMQRVMRNPQEDSGEPFSETIPPEFMEAYYRSLLNMGIRAPEAQRLSKKLQQEATVERTHGSLLDTSGENKGITQRDLSLGNHRKPFSWFPKPRRDTNSSTEIGNIHLGEVIEDPVGHILWTIQAIAEATGVPIKTDEDTVRRIAKIHPKKK